MPDLSWPPLPIGPRGPDHCSTNVVFVWWVWRFAVAAMVLIASTVPAAHADSGFPDVNSYAAVDVEPYSVSLDFLGYTHGYQFAAPAGYRCRMYTAAKQYPADFGQCWGSLPGTSDNAVSMSEAASAQVASKDLSTFDDYSVWDSVKEAEIKKRFGPEDYRVLPVGSRLSRYDLTCVVDAQMTACITGKNARTGEQHGFVLSTRGNHLF